MNELLHVTKARQALLTAVVAGAVHRDTAGDDWLNHRRVGARMRELGRARLVSLPPGSDQWELTDRGRDVLRNGNQYVPRSPS